MKMKFALIPAVCLLSFQVNAEVLFQENSVRLGYQELLDAEDNNPHMFDQGYLSFYHTTITDWGSVVGWLWLENVLESSDNQQGEPGGATTKNWLRLDYSLGGGPFSLWVQSMSMANTTCVEQNLYLGVSAAMRTERSQYSLAFGGNYSYGSFSPSRQSFNGLSGFGVTAMATTALSELVTGRLYYEAQLDRDDDHQRVMTYKRNGYQAIAALDFNITDKFIVSANYNYMNSWGPAKFGGSQLFFEVGYKF